MNNFKEPQFTTENGFFNLMGYVSYCLEQGGHNPDWKKAELSPLFIIQAERNMGKSYGTWLWIEEEIWIKSNFTEKIVYLRTNEIKLKLARASFNNKWYYEKKLYYMSDSTIFKCTFNEEGIEQKDLRIPIGYTASVTNAEKFKSGEYPGIKAIFWDEFNELTDEMNIFDNFIDLFKTLERFTKPVMGLLIGNKVNPNNEILVNFEIEPPLEDDGEDLIEEFDPYMYYINISHETFKHLEQGSLLANRMAKFSKSTNRYLNEGGQLVAQERDVLVWRKRVEPTHQTINYLQVGTNTLEYGQFEQGWYVRPVESIDIKDGYHIISMDVLADLSNRNSKKMFSEKGYTQLAQTLLKKAKNKELFYTSFDAKILIENFVLKWVKLINK